jgi:hypothetical protein
MTYENEGEWAGNPPSPFGVTVASFKKDARKVGKVRTDLFSPVALMEAGRVLSWGCRPKDEGGKGYAPWDWLQTTSVQDFLGAIQRHSAKLQMGQDIDDESGLLHSAHILANAMMLAHICTLEDMGARDDRASFPAHKKGVL